MATVQEEYAKTSVAALPLKDTVSSEKNLWNTTSNLGSAHVKANEIPENDTVRAVSRQGSHRVSRIGLYKESQLMPMCAQK
jgi:hypothetical protein